MSELDSEIFKKLQELKNKISDGTADSAPSSGGQIDISSVAKIQKLIAEMVSKFKVQKKFDWRIHILEPIGAIVEVAKLVGHDDRASIEKFTNDIIVGLYKEYSPKLPWIPQFLSNWITAKLVSSIIPSVVDWILDKIYGPDED